MTSRAPSTSLRAGYAEVIGDPIDHSLSPTIHNFWLEALGIEGDYGRRQVTRADLPAYIAEKRADPDWRGSNVRISNGDACAEPVTALVGGGAMTARRIAKAALHRRTDDLFIGDSSSSKGRVFTAVAGTGRPEIMEPRWALVNQLTVLSRRR